jgi:hypothetical protein
MTGESNLPELTQSIEWLLAGHVNEARAALKQLIYLDPMNDEAWVWFISTLATENAREKARALWLKMNPQSKYALDDLSEIAEARKEFERIFLESRQPVLLVEQDERILPDTYQPSEGENGSVSRPVVNQMHTEQIQVIQRGAPPRKPEKKKKPNNLIILLVASFLFMTLSLAAIGYFITRLYGVDVISLFTTNSDCTCENTDAYMLRIADRVRIWNTNQSLLMNITSTTDISGNVKLAQATYQEELDEEPPRCLKDVHEIMLSLLEYHVKYANALSVQDTNLVDYYFIEQQAKQDELKTEFIRISNELECRP